MKVHDARHLIQDRDLEDQVRIQGLFFAEDPALERFIEAVRRCHKHSNIGNQHFVVTQS